MGLDVAGVLRARRLREAVPQGPADPTRRCPTTPGSPATLAELLPQAVATQVRRADRGPPAAPRDHHQLRRQLRWSTVAASPSPTARARRPVRHPSRSPAPTSCAARSSTSPATCARSRRPTTSSAPRPQTSLYLEFRRLLDRSVRWFLTSRPATLDIAAEVARFRPGIAAHAGRIPELLQGQRAGSVALPRARLRGQGHPRGPRARPRRRCSTAYSLLDCIEIAEDTGERLDDVVEVYFLTSETFSDRRDARPGSRCCRATTVGTRWLGAPCETTSTRCSTCLTRSVLEVSDRRARPPSGSRVVRAQRRRARAGPGRPRRDRADVLRRHRRTVGRAAHPAHGDEARVIHRGRGEPDARSGAVARRSPCREVASQHADAGDENLGEDGQEPDVTTHQGGREARRVSPGGRRLDVRGRQGQVGKVCSAAPAPAREVVPLGQLSPVPPSRPSSPGEGGRRRAEPSGIRHGLSHACPQTPGATHRLTTWQH